MARTVPSRNSLLTSARRSAWRYSSGVGEVERVGPAILLGFVLGDADSPGQSNPP